MSEPTPAPADSGRDYELEHEREWDDHADTTLQAMQDFTLSIFQTYIPTLVIERAGRVTARLQDGAQALVDLTDAPGGARQSVTAQVGEPLIKPSEVGRRCRVWERVGYRVEQRRVVVTSRTYLLDTVLGPG